MLGLSSINDNSNDYTQRVGSATNCKTFIWGKYMGGNTKKDLITSGIFISAIVVLIGLGVLAKKQHVGSLEGTQPVASVFQAQDEDCD